MTVTVPGSLPPGMAELHTAVAQVHAATTILRRSIARSSTTGHTRIPSATNRPTAFTAIPFGLEDLQIVYEDFIKQTIESKCGLDCIRGDDMFGSNVIMEDIQDAISTSQIIIADLTGANANVFYEIGMAHAMEKPVLLLTQSTEYVPFDLRHRRLLIYNYSPRGCKLLETHLEQHVRAMVDLS